MVIESIESLDELIFPFYRLACEEILDVYHSGDLRVVSKEDSSPVTSADLLSHRVIKEGLESIYTGIPVLSEEERYPSTIPSDFWLIDPLDGTKEFINKSDEFTINIALICNGMPVYGFVGAPALDRVWTSNSINFETSVKSNDSSEPLRIVGSKSHPTEREVEFLNYLTKQKIDYQYKTYGSSLKICMLASGEADLYPRFGPTSEWDIAAAHAVLLAAGGNIIDISSLKPLEYGKKDTIFNPWFVAFSESLDLAKVSKIFNDFS